MFSKDTGERGSIILLTLFIFFVVCILLILAMQLSALEMYMSEYYYRSLQAQQLADASLEQCCAEISQSLRKDYADIECLPALPLGWRGRWTDIPLAKEPGRCHAYFVSHAYGSDYCSYKVSFKGCYENASKSLEAELTFRFVETWDAQQEFMFRTYSDYGTITDYKIIYN